MSKQTEERHAYEMRYLPRYYTKVKVTGSIRCVNTVVYIDTDTRIIRRRSFGGARKKSGVLFEEFVRATRRLSPVSYTHLTLPTILRV